VLCDPTSDFAQWAKKNTQACPSCHIIVERTEGCNSMACKCGAVFCYQCGAAACICQLRVPEERLAFWHVHSGVIPAVPSTAAPAAPLPPPHHQEDLTVNVHARRIQALMRGVEARRRIRQLRETGATAWLAAVDQVDTACAPELVAAGKIGAPMVRACSAPDLYAAGAHRDGAAGGRGQQRSRAYTVPLYIRDFARILTI
jgi:hypothetical protein